MVSSRHSREVLFYARSDYERNGGIFFGRDPLSGIPRTVVDFRRILDATEKTAYLIIDIEDGRSPAWLYPLNRDNARTVEGMGFQMVHAVWIPSDAGCDLPTAGRYADIPSFLEHLGLPPYRTVGAARERVAVVVFRKDVPGPFSVGARSDR